MSAQNLIIYKFNSLYHILEELSLDLNFKINFADSKNSLKDQVKDNNNSLIITNALHTDIGNHFILDNSPINIFKLVSELLLNLLIFLMELQFCVLTLKAA